jgi:branched-chain amino acid transport system permease protein
LRGSGDDFLEYEASKEATYVITAMYEDEATGDYTMLIKSSKALSFASDYAMYYIIIPLSVFLMLAARNIIRTRVGRAFISVRDNDLAAELLGINVFTYKLQAFFLSAVYAGIAGALFAAETNSLSLQAFQLDRSIEFLAMLIVGGAGFPLGAMFGASFFTLMNEFVIPNITTTLRETLPDLLPFVEAVNIQASINPILFGSILIIFLILEPRGIAYRWEILKVAWKIRPYSQN